MDVVLVPVPAVVRGRDISRGSAGGRRWQSCRRESDAACGCDGGGIHAGRLAAYRLPLSVESRASMASRCAAGDRPDDDSLRQRACGELLRQEAIRQDLLDAGDVAGDAGAQSETATSAIEALAGSDHWSCRNRMM